MTENIFDTCVNMGVRTGSRLVQVTIGINPEDGIIGSQSLEQINEADEGVFLPSYTIAKIARYAYICNRNKTQRRFLLGWVNRTLGGS